MQIKEKGEKEMIVVKLGGGRALDPDAVLLDLVQYDFVLVHGGSHRLNELSEELGHPPTFVTSVSGQISRLTDRRTMELFNMVYAGQTNKSLVEKLQALGVNAVGLSGLDGRLLEGRRKRALKVIEGDKIKVIRGDLSGTVERVNAGLLRWLLGNGYRPVLTPPAISAEGVAINVDGDRCAARVAVALGAERLVILSDVPGLLRDVNDEASLIPRLPRGEIDDSIANVARGRMKKKLLAAKEALDGGVGAVILADGRVDRPVTHALQGAGTWVR